MNGLPVPTDAGFQITADFAAKTITGNGGCNDYDGTYALAGSKGFTVKGEIVSTGKICGDDPDAAEAEYLSSLTSVTQWKFDDVNAPSRLTLASEDKSVLLVFHCDPFECPVPK